LKILIVGASEVGGSTETINAYTNFLLSKGHVVNKITVPGNNFPSRVWYYYQRGTARLSGHEKRHMIKTADLLEKRIRREAYDVVIGVETPQSYVLTRELNCLKIFSCLSLEADQLYFSSKTVDNERVRTLRAMELEIMEKSDNVIFPWKTTENYVRRNIWNGNNLSTIKYGCYPKDKIASYFFPVSIISFGHLWGYWSNKELLSNLSLVSPYHIDVYSQYKPPRKYHLNYKGRMPMPRELICSYQFGLNTITKDSFRKNHFASRPLGYMAYGLPVLSPDWMQLSKELKGCIPYNESNFVDLVDKYSEKENWEKLSQDAIGQAKELDWRKTLEPLEKMITQT
jgi:hypothetical protein